MNERPPRPERWIASGVRECGRVVTRLLLCSAVPLLLLTSHAAGQEVYKYQDQDGNWNYTDKRPNREHTVQRGLQTRSFQPPTAYVERRDSQNASELVIVNRYYSPVEFGVRLSDMVNLAADTREHGRFLVPPLSEAAIIEITPGNAQRRWRYSFEYRYMLGDPETSHRPDRPYRVPFSLAKSFEISQAYPAQYSHRDISSRYAVDIAMPVGTSIYAARGGVVVDVAGNFFSNGTDVRKDGPRANFVRVIHDDGTMAVYAHLQWDSIRVRPGDTVQRGEYIADSGNTGFSTGPHLHFAIQRNAGMSMISVSFQFEGANGVAFTPKEGSRVTAY